MKELVIPIYLTKYSDLKMTRPVFWQGYYATQIIDSKTAQKYLDREMWRNGSEVIIKKLLSQSV